MKYSNAEKRKIVKEDYDAIAEVFVNSYSEINLYKPYVDKFVKSLNGKKNFRCWLWSWTIYKLFL